MITIVEDCAKKLGCKPTEVFLKAAISNGYIAYNQQATLWISRHVECQCIPDEVVDWCLTILVPRKQLQGGLS